MSKIALITGITGQDGSYLAEFLMDKKYIVHGIIRRSSTFNTSRIAHLQTNKYLHTGEIILHYGDMTDSISLTKIIDSVRPDEIYNLAAQSHVKISFEIPEYTAEVSGLGVLKLLEAVKNCKLEKHTKIYQASTSEMFGDTCAKPQNELTPFQPCSPYGAAKLYAHHICKIYREAFNIFICCGILFNHESPRRGDNFVTRKITRAVARIKDGKQAKVVLGNLNAVRDWGHARDFIRAMWMMLNQDKPDDYVIATSECHTVREFVVESFRLVGLNISWEGEGFNEVGVDQNGVVRVSVDVKYFREKEVDFLLGDPTKATNDFGWKPKITFKELVKEMVEEDIKLFQSYPDS